MFVAQRPGFIDRMKAVTLNQFLQQWFENDFQNTTFALPRLVNAYAEGHNGVILPAMIGHISRPPDERVGIEYFGFDNGDEIVHEIAMRAASRRGVGGTRRAFLCIYRTSFQVL